MKYVAYFLLALFAGLFGHNQSAFGLDYQRLFHFDQRFAHEMNQSKISPKFKQFLEKVLVSSRDKQAFEKILKNKNKWEKVSFEAHPMGIAVYQKGHLIVDVQIKKDAPLTFTFNGVSEVIVDPKNIAQSIDSFFKENHGKKSSLWRKIFFENAYAGVFARDLGINLTFVTVMGITRGAGMNAQEYKTFADSFLFSDEVVSLRKQKNDVDNLEWWQRIFSGEVNNSSNKIKVYNVQCSPASYVEELDGKKTFFSLPEEKVIWDKDPISEDNTNPSSAKSYSIVQESVPKGERIALKYGASIINNPSIEHLVGHEAMQEQFTKLAEKTRPRLGIDWIDRLSVGEYFKMVQVANILECKIDMCFKYAFDIQKGRALSDSGEEINFDKKDGTIDEDKALQYMKGKKLRSEPINDAILQQKSKEIYSGYYKMRSAFTWNANNPVWLGYINDRYRGWTNPMSRERKESFIKVSRDLGKPYANSPDFARVIENIYDCNFTECVFDRDYDFDVASIKMSGEQLSQLKKDFSEFTDRHIDNEYQTKIMVNAGRRLVQLQACCESINCRSDLFEKKGINLDPSQGKGVK